MAIAYWYCHRCGHEVTDEVYRELCTNLAGGKCPECKVDDISQYRMVGEE